MESSASPLTINSPTSVPPPSLPQDSPLPVIQRLRAGKEFVKCVGCESGRFRLPHFCRAGRHPISPLDTFFTHGSKSSIFPLIVSLVPSFILISSRPSPPLESFIVLNEASSLLQAGRSSRRGKPRPLRQIPCHSTFHKAVLTSVKCMVSWKTFSFSHSSLAF